MKVKLGAYYNVRCNANQVKIRPDQPLWRRREFAFFEPSLVKSPSRHDRFYNREEKESGGETFNGQQESIFSCFLKKSVAEKNIESQVIIFVGRLESPSKINQTKSVQGQSTFFLNNL